MSREKLGDVLGISNRVIAYYETDHAQPPGTLFVDLAKALNVSADELLGLKAAKEKASPKRARLLKRLQQVEKLPQSDQRAVLKFVDALLQTRRYIA
ncbi:MAG: helix-turn-helix domain-containing protein [Gemmatimonadales bacterium]